VTTTKGTGTAADLRQHDLVAIDTETNDERLTAEMGSGWPHRQGYICGISVAYRDHNSPNGIVAHYIPLNHPDSEVYPKEQVSTWLLDHVNSSVKFLTQNGVYDWDGSGAISASICRN
jgi:hypothetical protein